MDARSKLLEALDRLGAWRYPDGSPDREAQIARLTIERNLVSRDFDVGQRALAAVFDRMFELGLRDEVMPLLDYRIHFINSRFEEFDDWRARARPFLELKDRHAGTVPWSLIDVPSGLGEVGNERWADDATFRIQLDRTLLGYQERGEPKEEEGLIRSLLNRSRKEDQSYSAASGPLFRRLADLRARTGKTSEAKAIYERSLEEIARATKPWHDEERRALIGLVACLRKLGNEREADRRQRQCDSVPQPETQGEGIFITEHSGPREPSPAESNEGFADLAGKIRDAASNEPFDPDGASFVDPLVRIADVYREAGELDKAIALLEIATTRLDRYLKEYDQRTVDARSSLAALYAQWGAEAAARVQYRALRCRAEDAYGDGSAEVRMWSRSEK